MLDRTERHEGRPTPGSRNRVWARLGSVLFTTVLLGIVGGIAYLGTWPPLRIVMSSSMEPAISAGDVVVVKAVSGEPRVGEVVLMEVPADVQDHYHYPERVIHRVVEITEDGLVRTQGDNLPEPDPFGVPTDSIGGRVIHIVPGVGRALAFITSPFGLAWLIGGLVLFGLMPFLGSQRDILGAVEEYGYHLRSHTQILKSMSAASQDLSATVVQLREVLAERPPPGLPVAVPPPPATLPPAARIAPVRAAVPSRPSGGAAGPPPLHDRKPVLYDDAINPLLEPVQHAGPPRPGGDGPAGSRH